MTIRDLIDRAKREEYITVLEFCALTRRNPQAVYRAIRRGRVPGVHRIDRSLRLHRTTVIAYYARQGPAVNGLE
jgi:hypothetical protein